MELFLCPFCQLQNKKYKLNQLAVHSYKEHDKSGIDLCLILFHNNIKPTCECGCGESVKFLSVSRGFTKYIKGHYARINNPHIFRSTASLKEGGKKRSEKYKSGELKVWCEGKTKDTDERIMRLSLKGSKTLLANKEEIKKRSLRMKENRKNGTIKTLTKECHSQWKGGISPLNQYCHGNKRLYKEWKYPILLKANFQCIKCQATSCDTKIQVHHDKESFSEILRLFALKHQWNHKLATSINSEDNIESLVALKDIISNDVADYHIQNNVSGIVLCEECHKKEHVKLNF